MINRDIQTAVITGPTGCIGTALAQNLLDKGITVYAVVRPDSKRIDNLPKDVQIIFCDLSDLESLPNLIPSADAFFHLGWANTIGPGRNDMPSQIQNIQYAIDAVRAANKLGCNVFIGAGSQAEYGPVEGVLKPDTPRSPKMGYGIAKNCAGDMTRIECEKFQMDHIWIRVLSIYGPCDGEMTMISSVIKSLLNGEKPSLTKGEQFWDYLYSKDAAEAFCKAAFHGVKGKTYPLGSGKAIPLRQYIETLRDAIDPGLSLGFGEIPYGLNQVMHLEADISELQADTGFIPSYSFKDGITETIAWKKEHL